MNDHLFASEVAALLGSATYAQLFAAVPTILPDQAADDSTRPLITVAGDWTQYLHRRMGTLALELRGRVGDETANEPNHQSRFSLLFTALLGAQGADATATKASRAAAKAAFKTALSARGKVEVADYGPGENAVEATVDGEDLVTTLRLRVVWAFLPPA